MKYKLFLFDLDDTLLDFRASEQLSFTRTMRELGLHEPGQALFPDYQAINLDLWKRFEQGTVTKDFLKVERFRQVFDREHEKPAPSGVVVDERPCEHQLARL